MYLKRNWFTCELQRDIRNRRGFVTFSAGNETGVSSLVRWGDAPGRRVSFCVLGLLVYTAVGPSQCPRLHVHLLDWCVLVSVDGTFVLSGCIFLSLFLFIVFWTNPHLSFHDEDLYWTFINFSVPTARLYNKSIFDSDVCALNFLCSLLQNIIDWTKHIL